MLSEAKCVCLKHLAEVSVFENNSSEVLHPL
jgi:hypothetical protein